MPSRTASLLRIVSSAVVAALLLYATAARPVHAFTSYPIGAQHDQITESAATNKGWNKDTIDSLQEAVRNPDYDESMRVRLLFYRPNDKYVASHHFDRGPTSTSAATFTASSAYLRQQIADTITAARNGESAKALLALGRALHVLQDFKSHANYIDMDDADQQKCRDALADGNKAPPAGLKLTGYDPDPNLKDPEQPANDCYSHGNFSKDKPGKNAEARKLIGTRTKFQVAKDSAVAESTCLLQQVQNGLTGAQWTALKNAVIQPEPNDAKYKGKCSTPCLPAGCSLDCTLDGKSTTLSFTPGTFSQPGITVTVLAPPDYFFFTADLTIATDGAWTVVHREIRARDSDDLAPDPTYFVPAAAASIAFSKSSVLGLRGASLKVYYFDQGSNEWNEVPGGNVSLSGAGGVATFDVAAPGNYAVGGQMIPAPGDVFVLDPRSADDSGCVPDTKNHLKCSDGVAKAFAKAERAVQKCHLKAANAAFKQSPVDDESCDDGPSGKSAKGKLDAALAKLTSACAGTSVLANAAAAETLLFANRTEPTSFDAQNGAVYCDSTSGALIDPSGDDAGFVPNTPNDLKCANTVGTELAKLAATAIKCHMKMADRYYKGAEFDEHACSDDDPVKGKSALEKYAAAMNKLDAKGLCVQPCLSRPQRDALGAQIVARVDASNFVAYACAPTTTTLCPTTTTTTTTSTTSTTLAPGATSTTTTSTSTTTTTLCLLTL